jgi:tetratricopeptide (TPR) repeat protein
VRRALALSALWLSACAGQAPARSAEADRARAESYAARADAASAQGDVEAALELATRALVVRIASSGPDSPEVGLSFVQLGDLRWRQGRRGWAAQSFGRALELFALEPERYAAWRTATRERLTAVCADIDEPAPACEQR